MTPSLGGKLSCWAPKPRCYSQLWQAAWPCAPWASIFLYQVYNAMLHHVKNDIACSLQGQASAIKTMQFNIIQWHYNKATKEESNRGAWKSNCSQVKDAQSSIKNMCYSFLKKGNGQCRKLGRCPGRIKQSSAFCIWFFMCNPKIEPLHQAPSCRWGNRHALYNFTVGTSCSYSDINL